MLFEFIYFLVLILLVIYLPGRFLLRFFKYDFDDPIITAVVSLLSGLSLFIFSTYILSWLGLGFLYNFFVLPLIFLEGKRLRKVRIGRINLPGILLVIIGSLGMVSLTAFSAIPSGKELLFYASNSKDGIYHLSLIGNLIHNFPPTHPELAQIPLRGYHFFYDSLIANFSLFYRLDTLNSLFRYFPLLIAFIYGLSGFAFAKFLKLKEFSTSLFLFLLYFAGGFDFILKYVLPKEVFYNPGINPLLVNIVNPSVLISMSLLFVFIVLIFGKNKSIILPALILGIMPQVKIYIALLTFIGLGAIALMKFARNKDTYFLKILLLAGFIGSIVFIPFNLGSGGLILTPLLLYRHFMESLSYDWGLRLQIFENDSNYIRIALLYLKALAIFFIPTLGLRLISLYNSPKLLKRSFYSSQNIFWVVFIASGVFLASFFIQSVDVFNIVQFLWPIYIILLIPAVISIETLTKLLFKDKKFAKIVIFVLVVLISLPPNIALLKNYSSSPYKIEKDRIDLSKYIKNSIPQNEGILVINREKEQELYDLPEFAALSQHPIYYESTITSFKDSEGIKINRKKVVSRIEFLVKSCVGDVSSELKKEMKESNSKYIVTLKNYPCMKSAPDFKERAVFGEMSLYEFVPYENN